MTETNSVEIPLSKTKLIKLLFFSVAFLFAGLWMLIKDPQVSNPVFNNVITKSVASYGSIIMGALGIYFASRKLFDKKPGLVLNEQGIYDNTSAFKFGLIPWSDISAIYESSMQASIASKQHFVTIGLTDPDKYILRESNFLKKRLLQINARSYGSPIHISTNGLKTNHQELLQLIASFFEKYKYTAS